MMAVLRASFQDASVHGPEVSINVMVPRMGDTATTAHARWDFSSVAQGSTTMVSAWSDTLQLLTMSFISIPASMSARVAALINALATLPSFSITWRASGAEVVVSEEERGRVRILHNAPCS